MSLSSIVVVANALRLGRTAASEHEPARRDISELAMEAAE
jgi:hypothetical protein